VELVPGISAKTLCHGEETNMTAFTLKKGSLLPEHSHPHEQTGYLVRGRMRMHAGQAVQDVLPGDSWSIPKNVLHRAEVLEDSFAVEVFAPLRPEYLKFERAEDISGA